MAGGAGRLSGHAVVSDISQLVTVGWNLSREVDPVAVHVLLVVQAAGEAFMEGKDQR